MNATTRSARDHPDSEAAAANMPGIAMWNRMAQKYARAKMGDEAGYQRSVARTADLLSPEDRVLEIGCGTGSTALLHAGRVREIVATDGASAMIAIARDKAEAAGITNVTFKVAPADWPEPAGSFDVAMAHNLLHLLPDRPAVLEAVRQSLRPGGLFISKTPCLAEMNVVIRRIVIPVMMWWFGLPKFDLMAEADLVAALEEAGFVVESVEHHGSKARDFRPFIIARRV